MECDGDSGDHYVTAHPIATVKPSEENGTAAMRWRIQVDQVDPGGLDLDRLTTSWDSS
jgi:hypothetical protein